MLNGNYTESNGKGFFQELKLGFRDLAFDINDWCLSFFSHFRLNMRKFWLKIKISDSWRLTGMLSFVGFFIFMYTMITQSGTIPFNGDFKLQGMTFIYNGYDDWHYYFKTGIFPLWDTSGLLGVDNITANSFYYLFDPFFLVLLPFPRSILNQVQAVVTILKFVLAGVFFYHYLGSFHLKKSTKKVGAMAYAFCGWGFFYLWFFHFAEAMTFFPLILWGVEKCFSKKDPRLLVLSLLLMGATNYQFLAIFGFYAFIYAMFRFFQTIFKRSAKDSLKIIGIGFIGFSVGLLLTAFIIVPNYIDIQDMSRVSNTSYLDSLFANDTLKEKLIYMFTWDDSISYKYMYPLTSMLFINVSSWGTPLYYPTSYDNVGSSLYIFAPLLLLIVPSMIDAIRKKKISHIIGAALVVTALEMPFIYWLSGAFANTYGRWELAAVAAMIVFVCTHLDNVKSFKGWYFDLSILVVAAAFAFAVYKAYQYAGTASGLNGLDWDTKNDLYYEFKYLVPIQAVYLFLIYLFLRFKYCRPNFRRNTLYIVGVEAIIMGNVTIIGLGTTDYDNSLFGGHDNMTQQTEIIDKLSDYDDSFYRIFNSNMTRSNNNLAMVEGYNGVGTFCSVYNYESEDLYKYWSRISYSNTWSFGVHLKRNNLDELLGIKYYLLDYDDTNVPYGCVDVTTLDSYPEELKNCLYSENNTDNKFKLYLNTNFVDTAFAFDSYMSADLMDGNSYEEDPENKNEINYLKHAILYEDYIDEHEDELSKFEEQTSSESISSISNYTLKSKESIYNTNWDEEDLIHTLDPILSDSEYNELYGDTLEEEASEEGSNIYYDSTHGIYRYSINEDNFFITPGDTVYDERSQLTSASKGLNYYSKVVFDGGEDYTGTPIPLLASEASERDGAYVSISSKFGYNIDFYLYGYDFETQTYHVITHDQHMTNNYKKDYDWKYGRGFYVDEPVYKVVGLVKQTMNEDDQVKVNAMYYEYNDEYQQDVDKLLASPITVNYRDANTLNYTSNYDKDKIVVLNIPYNEGWTLTQMTTDENGNTSETNVDFFKADGGLIGYIAPKGETNYNLSYYTQGLSTGLKLTYVGLSFTTAIIGIYYSLNYTKKILSRINKAYSLKGL